MSVLKRGEPPFPHFLPPPPNEKLRAVDLKIKTNPPLSNAVDLDNTHEYEYGYMYGCKYGTDINTDNKCYTDM